MKWLNWWIFFNEIGPNMNLRDKTKKIIVWWLKIEKTKNWYVGPRDHYLSTEKKSTSQVKNICQAVYGIWIKIRNFDFGRCHLKKTFLVDSKIWWFLDMYLESCQRRDHTSDGLNIYSVVWGDWVWLWQMSQETRIACHQIRY